MASAVIHMVIAHEINQNIKRDNNKLLIGSIAPDISKFIGEDRAVSHFINEKESDIPAIDKFLDKYKTYLNDDFVLGYFIHLYTDYLWFKYFIPEIVDKDCITKLDGSVHKCTEAMLNMYIYNDYTNLNIQLLELYNMDLKIFYNEPPIINNIIEEIPMDKLDVIINQVSIIIENTKKNKDLVFNIDNINKFIETSVDLIIAKLKELNIG